jgi:dimethylargininase
LSFCAGATEGQYQSSPQTIVGLFLRIKRRCTNRCNGQQLYAKLCEDSQLVLALAAAAGFGRCAAAAAKRRLRVRLTQAIVRIPAANFAAGMASAIGGGEPDVMLALEQHERYCAALRDCGLEVTSLPPDPHHPDSTFVEDTAVVIPGAAIVTRPGARSRLGEAAAMLTVLRGLFSTVREIKVPGTVDGGDVCEADGDFIIGQSARTNEEGARQLSTFLSEFGHKSTLVDIRRCKALLHLKTGLSYLGDGVFVVAAEAPLGDVLKRYELMSVSPAETYAANCIRVNKRILIAAGYPRLLATLTARGYQVIALEMSEFRKMDGGLSCLSLRI